jgi:dTDP-4-amino-4,6-dideoxygalactose transaminase
LVLKISSRKLLPSAAKVVDIEMEKELEFLNKPAITRRGFLTAIPAAGVAMQSRAVFAAEPKPALLGGKPVRTEPFPSWPVFDTTEEKALTEVVRSGKWGRGTGKQVDRFEAAYARLTGARSCLATVNGSNALYISLNMLGVEPGDEVLVPPFTFVATVNVVLRQHALPVFVDSDIDSFQMDPHTIEPLITERTRAIIPVHLGGNAADMDGVLAAVQKHKLVVIEDACQAWIAQWRGRNVGRLGDCGCFSFQATKNLNCGEGGAIVSDNEEFIERCFGFQTQGRMRKLSSEFGYTMSGTNLRMTEFQAAMLLAQMTRLEEQSKRREANATYLTSLLREIPGILPAKMYDGCTRNAYHLYLFRYQADKFAGLSREKFLAAMQAEGIGPAAGYEPLNKSAFLKATFQSRGFRRLFPPERFARWEEQNRTPANDRLCREACWLGQNHLLADRTGMDQIAEAIRKIQKCAPELARA